MRNYTSSFKRWIWIFLCLGVLESCHIVKPFFIKNKKKEERKERRAERKAVRGNLVTVDIDSTLIKKEVLSLSPKDTETARSLIQSRKLYYKTFQCKAKMHFESGDEKQNFTANFRLEKDNVIWVSITAPLIGEVARAVVTPDSVKAIERINKRSYLYTYADIQKLINIQVDFNTLQDLIVGNALSTEGSIFDVKELGGLSTIFIKGDEYNNQLTFVKSDSTLKQLQLQTVRSVSTSSILIAYQKYENTDGRKFPSIRNYHIQDVKGAAELDMEIAKYEFDGTIDFPFSIPANYKLKE